MKQITKTICNKNELSDFIEGIKKVEFYIKSKSILVQIYTSIADKKYVEEILKIIKQQMPEARIAGLSTCAEISNGIKQKQSLVTSFMFFEDSEIFVDEYNLEKESQKKIFEKLWGKIKSKKYIEGIQIFATSMKFSIDNFVEMIDLKNTEIQLFGSGAGTLSDEMDDIFVFGDTILKNGMIVVLFCGKDLHIEVDYNLGWIPIGKEMKITEISGKLCISKIDDRPAFDIYKKYLNVEKNEFFWQNIMEFPIMIKRDDMIITRTPIDFDEEGKVFFVADIHKGEKIRFSYGKSSKILAEDAEVCDKIYNFDAQAVILYACGNREVFLKEANAQEVKCFGNIHSEVAGCYAFAEIMKNKTGGGILNSALIVVSMREKELTGKKDFREINRQCYKDRTDNFIPLTERLISLLEAVTDDLKEYAGKLEELATIDELTQLNNRRRIDQILQYEMNKRTKAGKLSIVILDIDNFKKVNDEFGHDAGDNVLKGMAESVKSVIRQQDSLGRWGGEEFLCILPDTVTSDAVFIAERIRRVVASKEYDKVGKITISLGLTTATGNDTFESIFERVDKALYDAKRTGKNKVQVW